ncbi:ABC transporter ATP-binding protein [Marinitenerispora sediminis]|uniref:ABC-type quaternary amine transporter n=1 Tax=Marinitenerispora sediminis TaxID=1931232 RepID=A0A368T1Z9_9ACTN|nr:ABC transporter ATP-binding protein [Marinitenerispora sediminis]RCV49300.1 ABC transporter ATP-binding protein [Marinitenerispora sediminis]RCV50557.1 ABC transporter ATP-binding protein [Marinitenerispora sediminis]RCV54803.1 ABC transporter ATP-binding protein [Marinitenerispora sediminis]
MPGGGGAPASAALAAHLVVRRGGFVLDVRLRAAAGEVLALLGPNGAGKSTALRALAGLTAMADGQIVVDGRDLTTTPTERRPIGMVFQDYLLFEHMSALENVAFGPRARGVPKAEARARAAELLERVGLAAHARRRPRALSGGQAQRVALARALAVRPRLLLLDEPLAALDAHTRADVRSRLRRDLADFDGAAVIVTHDPLDAMVLADRVTVIEDGAVVQEGPPTEVARRPRTDYVARLVGLNLYRGTARGAVVEVAEAAARIEVAEPRSGEVFAAFPPRAVALFREPPVGTLRNVWRLRIDGIEPFGDHVRVHLADPDSGFALSADVTPAGLADLAPAVGAAVWAGVKATEVRCYPVG